MARKLSLAVALVALVACKKQIDASKVEKSIVDGLAQKHLAAKVTCPGGREAKKDDTFTCDAVDDAGNKLVITVTQQDEAGTVQWKLDGQILDVAMVVADAKSKLAGAEISCDRKAVVVKDKDTYTCPITKAPQTKLVIKVEGSDVRWEAN